MKTILLIGAMGISGLSMSQMTMGGGTQQIPYNEVTHKQKKATITTESGTVLEGVVNYNEYGEQKIYLFQNGEKKATTLDNIDTLQTMQLEGRGTFKAVDLYGTGHKLMVLVLEDNDAYESYQLCSVGQGLLGYKIVGGNLEGQYLHFVLHKRKEKIYDKKNVRKIEKTISEYIDYCDEITKKIEKKEKGYKATLLKPDFEVLKQAILESEMVCK